MTSAEAAPGAIANIVSALMPRRQPEARAIPEASAVLYQMPPETKKTGPPSRERPEYLIERYEAEVGEWWEINHNFSYARSEIYVKHAQELANLNECRYRVMRRQVIYDVIYETG